MRMLIHVFSNVSKKAKMNFVKKNPIFFFLLLLLNIVVVFVLLNNKKGDEVLWIQQQHNPVLDFLFSTITKTVETIGIIIFFLFYLFINLKLFWYNGINMLLILIVVQSLKRLVFDTMLRPGAVLAELAATGNNELLSLYSFPSGHTAAAFSLMVMPLFFYPNKIWLQLSVFSLALSVGISRIYLGQHFLQDVIAGADIGVAVTVFSYFLLSKYNFLFPATAD